ncbi:MPN551 family DNA-binding protein [Ureaplasma diversum]|uniref:YqaJ viral recombinase domain-containing protein n=1 Tax=Ureaplasma diversum NCTC 246 TaxID=1188241 RepID=A0A084EYF1_9BACT|nr:YqaJ viral recombinase family protein [Ureaplasma diversum]KEZ22993.1 hypothetical protein UDIV_4290 [Ureaplasma diversum NCTC 246]
MPFIKKVNVDFKLEGNRIVLSKEYLANFKHTFSKITGSRIGSILSVSDYSNQVKTWAQMVKIYKEDIDKIYSDAGNIIEPKIKDYVEQKLNIKFRQYDPVKIKWDIFTDNKIFGGIPDGEPVDENGELLYPHAPMLEIKTTSIDSFKFKIVDEVLVLQKDKRNYPIIKKENEKREKWFKSNGEIEIPLDYKLQLGLYCYLRNITKGVFGIAFLTVEDYMNPYDFDVNKNEIIIVDYEINLKDFSKILEDAKHWYEEHIIKGISPELTDTDLKWFNIWTNK